ncbi:MAG: hypothetical protein JNL98_07670 [Bryobacterales bacterium]|nr:hypothetical protein [Bryobacterales bacterium]
MTSDFWLDLARHGLRFPIATDLALHADPDPQGARMDARRLATVLTKAAARYDLPVALPLMDLRLDKAALLAPFGVSAEDSETFHFTSVPENSPAATPAEDARAGSIRHIREDGRLHAVGQIIGPFSLATKLMRDPIAAIALAGAQASEEPEVKLWEWCLARSLETVLTSMEQQVESGAQTIMLCEPAANTVYLSPRQLRRGSDIFDRYVLAGLRRIKQRLDELHANLFLHDCGELLPSFATAFAQEIHPAVLSLGSSRRLWEDATLVPADVVLYGNLPSKLFYSDDVMPRAEVERRVHELQTNMQATGHPFLMGTECDVLYVGECAERIQRKVDLLQCKAEAPR